MHFDVYYSFYFKLENHVFVLLKCLTSNSGLLSYLKGLVWVGEKKTKTKTLLIKYMIEIFWPLLFDFILYLHFHILCNDPHAMLLTEN